MRIVIAATFGAAVALGCSGAEDASGSTRVPVEGAEAERVLEIARGCAQAPPYSGADTGYGLALEQARAFRDPSGGWLVEIPPGPYLARLPPPGPPSSLWLAVDVAQRLCARAQASGATR